MVQDTVLIILNLDILIFGFVKECVASEIDRLLNFVYSLSTCCLQMILSKLFKHMNIDQMFFPGRTARRNCFPKTLQIDL